MLLVTDGDEMEKKNPSEDYIRMICSLYNDRYDDREEDSAPGGEDWKPGQTANHTSLAAFQKELRDQQGVELSTCKLRKILITGGCWTTERSREVQILFDQYKSIRKVAEVLGVSDALVTMYLPYGKVVYDLEEKSSGAKRTERWREKKRG